MAQIRVNEISKNYAYSVTSASFATVALPITSAWGPGFVDPNTVGMERADVLEHTSWQRFPATRQGLEAFVAAYRGPASNHRIVKDYSYYQAMTLLSAGYDLLVCRLCPGATATNYLFIANIETTKDADGKTTNTRTPVGSIGFTAKYPGTFGNNLIVRVQKVINRNYWNIITYVKDSITGVTTAVENLTCYFDLNNPQDGILHLSELESEFLDIQINADLDDTKDYCFYSYVPEEGKEAVFIQPTPDTEVSELPVPTSTNANTSGQIILKGGTDTCARPAEDVTYEVVKIDENTEQLMMDGVELAKDKVKIESDDTDEDKSKNSAKIMLSRAIENVIARFKAVGAADSKALGNDVIKAYIELSKLSAGKDLQGLATHEYKEWLYYNVLDVYDLLKDKLTYNPNRIISPGWDDMDVTSIDGTVVTRFSNLSPIHCKLMEVAYYSRCACAYLDIPRCLPRSAVYNESVDTTEAGYAQMLSRSETYALNWSTIGADPDLNSFLYPTHAALFAPWGQYSYTGMSKMCPASPAFLALMIERAMIKNQSTQYEWILPTVRRHKLNIGKLDYSVSKKLLDQWQKLEGVGVNVITSIPDMGVSIWGNSTLFETPPATYQALANLSTRKLMNAVKDISYRCGLAITFQYNNDQAYAAFYAGVTPTLDNMKNAGAIEGYKISMAADINGLDRVNANTVIGVITLFVNGVINDINIDLIAMPAGAGLE